MRHAAIDGHADTIERYLANPAGFFGSGREGHLDSARLRETGQNVQVMAVYTPPDRTGDAAHRYALDFIRAYEALLDAEENRALDPPWQRILGKADLDRACRPGGFGFVLFLEGASPLRGSLADLDRFFALGVRGLTITHNHDNEAARGCFAEGPGAGLTAFGRELVSDLEARGMVIDLAHANAATIRDTLAIARGPVIDSHTGLRAFHGASPSNLRARALSDDEARAIAATGGVVCIDFLPDHLKGLRKPDRRVGLDDLAEVIAHAVEVAGIDGVGLGSDWDGFGGDPVEGLEDASCLPSVVAALDAVGFPDDAVAKILGGNLRRVLGSVLP
ncbi:MAG: membrane dipeptidase [Spirochaetes bacterium]|nr:membrane dipeptidase [Spirochaetota bacterium]